MAQDKVLQVSQIGIEAVLTPGTKVDGDTILHAFSFGMAREGGALTPFRPEGYRSSVLTKPTNRESATIPIEAVACYRCLTWLFDSLFFAATVADATLENLLDDSSDPTVAWQRTYEIVANAVAEERNTYTIEHGDSDLASYATFMVFNSLGITLNREDVALATAAFASKKTDSISLTAAPDEITAVPILAQQGLVYLEDAEADLATATAVGKLVEVEWHYNNAVKPRFSVDGSASYSELTELAPESGGSLKFWKNSDSMDLRAEAQAGTRKWLRIEFTGTVLNDNDPMDDYTYLLQITTPIEFTEPGDEGDDDDAVAVSLGFTSVHDAGEGYVAKIVLINDIDDGYAVDT